jgi:hypothetical protein
LEGAAAMLIHDRIEDFNKAKVLAHAAAKSGAYLYPIKVSKPTAPYSNAVRDQD